MTGASMIASPTTTVVALAIHATLVAALLSMLSFLSFPQRERSAHASHSALLLESKVSRQREGMCIGHMDNYLLAVWPLPEPLSASPRSYNPGTPGAGSGLRDLGELLFPDVG